ncbi:gluconate 2-dehydrogenase subunit 3 family protein [Pseudogracilibacillus sp. SE30717A]|uniref:gluconate 2-dehydrogenase subunit 3 family protein n=1 Tax=Pseudogracilibacillus sp. SE30717A TaxID=3098293 RepID=UPI00300DD27C
MTEKHGHYPTFNVMDEKEYWDSHTQEIVGNRLDKKLTPDLKFFTIDEVDTLYSLCSILLDDQRRPILTFIVHHFDNILQANIGESQRKANVPKQPLLIREGMELLNQVCHKKYNFTFKALNKEVKKKVVKGLMEGVFPLQDGKKSIPSLDFIHKIFYEATAAYYSHPTVWSEIGYAGPAYPRGYVRTELGLTDPWEARRDAE